MIRFWYTAWLWLSLVWSIFLIRLVSMVWFGLVEFTLAWFGQDWFVLLWFGLVFHVCLGFVLFSLVWREKNITILQKWD